LAKRMRDSYLSEFNLHSKSIFRVITSNHTLSGLTQFAMLSGKRFPVNPEGRAASPRTPNTSNCQFSTKTLFDVHPKAQSLQRSEIPSIEPPVHESNLAQLAENLESLVMSQSGVLFNLSPPFFTRVVEMTMRHCKSLSAKAQIRLADWILSKSRIIPDYLPAFAFLNHRVLHFEQVSEFFHFLASSPGTVPNVYETVVDDLLLVQKDVGQLKREVRTAIQNIAEKSINVVPTSSGIPAMAL
jgi:hypothetical protein